MSQIKTIFKNIGWLFISQIIASICGFIWTVLMARYLGVNQYGILGFGLSFSGIAAILCDLGIGTHIIRHIATDYESSSKYLGNAIPLKSLFCTITFIISLLILIIMKCNLITIEVTLLFVIMTIFKSFIGLFNGTFQAFEEGKYQGIGNTIINLLLLFFIIITIFTDLGIFGVTFSYVIANAIGLIYLYYYLKKDISKPNIEFDKSFCKEITILSIPFALSSLFYTIYYSIDVIMLTNLIGDYPTGIYNAAYKLISILTLFYSVYIAVIFPSMSKFFKNNEKLLIISFEKSVKYLLFITIPLAISTWIYSTDIIQLIYGQEYTIASEPLSILIWTVCLLFINGAFSTLLNASHKEMAVTKTYIIAATFNVLLNLYLIPKYQYNGAAIATVLSDCLIIIIFSYVMYKLKQTPNKNLFIDILKIITGSLILGIILTLTNLNMWFAIPIGIIIYLIIMILLKIFDDDDKFIIREILGRN